MAEQSPLERLLQVLRERNIPLSRDDVAWAFDSPKTREEVTKWVTQYLGQETLLSKEELDLYTRLEKDGTFRRISASQDLSAISPILDDDIRTAIERLNISTTEIEKQNQILKSQRDALTAMKEKSRQDAVARKRPTEQRQRRYAIEKQHIGLACDELSQNLTERLAASKQQIRSSTALLTPAVAETLRADDKLLNGLQRLAVGLETRDDDKDKIDRVQKLSAKLVEFRVEEVRCRLDRIFLEHYLASALSDRVGPNDQDSDEALELQEELEMLYPEIYSVTDMAVNHEFKDPIIFGLEKKEDERMEASDKAFEYITSTLSSLADRLDSLSSRIQNYHYHRKAIEAVGELAEKELAGSQEAASSPRKSRRFSRHMSLSQTKKSPFNFQDAKGRDSVAAAGNTGEPADQLLRLLSLSLPEGDRDERQRALEVAVRERQQKLRGQLASLESTLESSLVSYIGDAAMTSQVLTDTLYAQSKYHNVSLVDEELQLSIDALEKELSVVGKGMAGLDLEVLERHDPHREKFLERWA
ncbi:MAG: hypothetical protein M1819_004274 [Sarea resinae]|nr:MAG: hypothetical protein M1819_004274 [Sarea resinae]